MPSTRPWLKRNWQKVKGEADLQTVYISNVLLIQLLHGQAEDGSHAGPSIRAQLLIYQYWGLNYNRVLSTTDSVMEVTFRM